MSAVLVTGGAGYIGGQTVLSLLAAGYTVCVLDDLSTGRRLPFHTQTAFYEGRVHDEALVERIIRENAISSILHFAGSIKVDESVSNPLKYYENNTEGSRRLIAAAVRSGIENFIFSSTAAVYGSTAEGPVRECAPTVPLNPYGWSKLFTEKLLQDVATTGALRYGIFRYFNVAGADLGLRHGQYLERPVHLIGRAIDALLGKAPAIRIFGDNLPTPDGTGVRDYIHVCDVADAHVALLEDLTSARQNRLLNLGYGNGYSVREVLRVLGEIAGNDVPNVVGEARPGEAPSVIADVGKLTDTLAWQAKHDALDVIVSTALNWQRQLSGQER